MDRYLLLEERQLLERRDGAWATAVVVDVGLGAEPWTTRELADQFGRLGLPVIGVDNDPARVAAARTLAPALDVRVGGFDLPVPEPIRLVRAMNLLRGYPAEERDAARRRLGAGLLADGLLVEGSTCRTGRTVAARLYRKSGDDLAGEGLLFATDFSAGFAPRMFRGPTPLAARTLLDRWQGCWEVQARAGSDAERFDASSRAAGSIRSGVGWAVFPAPDDGAGAQNPATPEDRVASVPAT